MKLYFSFCKCIFCAKIRHYNILPNKVFRFFKLFRHVLNKIYFQIILNFQFTHDGVNSHLNKGHFLVIMALSPIVP